MEGRVSSCLDSYFLLPSPCSGSCYSTRLFMALQRASMELVPDPQYREALTWSNVPGAFGYLVPYLFMCYLARRRDTRPIRLLLLPTVLAMTIRGTYYYDWFDPRLFFFTWVRGTLLQHASNSRILTALRSTFWHHSRRTECRPGLLREG